jgi:hypothetical protein
MSKATWNVVGVLAGAYSDSNPKSALTHLEIPGTNDAACKRVKSGNLADAYSGNDDGDSSHATTGAVPTCPRCASML